MEHLESVERTDLLNILNSRNHCKNPILSISSVRFEALLFVFAVRSSMFSPSISFLFPAQLNQHFAKQFNVRWRSW